VLFAVNEVRPPVIFATLAVILSFLPMLFITGMMGPYMRPMALNVPVAMAMSLLVAFTITPWMAFYILRPLYGKKEGHADGRVGLFARTYRAGVAFFIDRRWSRWALLALILALLGGAGKIALSGAVPLKMLPYDNKSEFQLLVDLPEGVTLERTERAVRDFERYLTTVPEVKDFQAYVGTASPIDFNGLVRHYNFRQAPNLADLRVNLVGKQARSQQSHALTLRLRDDLERIAERHGARLKIVEMPPGPPVLATLVAEVRGAPTASYPELIEAARGIEQRLADLDGVVDTDTMAEDDHERLEFVLDKEKAALHGVDTADVVRTLRLALTGDPVATVHEPGERQPLVLKLVLSRARRSGPEELSQLRVKGSTGVLVPLAEIGRFGRRAEDPPVYHKDLERVVFVLGDIAGRPPADVVFAMQEHPLPEGFQTDWQGEGEWKITVDVFRDLGLAFAGALVAIYVLLVFETGTFFMPLLIMVAIPLGAIGIFPGFWALNRWTTADVGGYADPVWFTATGMIGMIALAGIVIRNAIILIDFIRNRHAEGMELREAADRADGVHDDARRLADHPGSHLLRPGMEPDLRDRRVDGVHARRRPGHLLRSVPEQERMRNMNRVLILLTVAFAAACGGPPSKQEVERARARAEDGAARLMQTLFQELMTALQAGPPEEALGICGDRAQQLTKAIENETGVKVRRTSLKTRNPLNAPDAYERSWLEKAAANPPTEPHSEVVETEDGGYELRYLRPLRIAKLCTQCHGEEFTPAVRDAVQRRYPSDQATGYKPGDLRGAISVRVRFD
jgi:multidrug efflux pump subunit AcrB